MSTRREAQQSRISAVIAEKRQSAFTQTAIKDEEGDERRADEGDEHRIDEVPSGVAQGAAGRNLFKFSVRLRRNLFKFSVRLRTLGLSKKDEEEEVPKEGTVDQKKQ
jgi:hypothetical protein